MDGLKKIESDLILKSLIVNEISFKRDYSITDSIDMLNSRTRFSNEIKELNHEDSLVSLSIHMMHKDNETELFIKMSGIFGFKDDVDPEFKEQMLRKNAVTIIFPYLRSQLSIITSQPGVVPVVLPVINILSLLRIDD